MKGLMGWILATTWIIGMMYAIKRRRHPLGRSTQDLIARARREQQQGYRAWGATYPDAHMTETYGNGR